MVIELELEGQGPWNLDFEGFQLAYDGKNIVLYKRNLYQSTDFL